MLDDRLQTISRQAFAKCSSLSSITIPYSVRSIGDEVFNGCIMLDRIAFEGDAPYVGTYAFANTLSTCIAFVNTTSTGWNTSIPGRWNGIGIDYIGSYVSLFTIVDNVLVAAQASALLDIAIPDNVISIANSVFSGYTNM